MVFYTVGKEPVALVGDRGVRLFFVDLPPFLSGTFSDKGLCVLTSGYGSEGEGVRGGKFSSGLVMV